MNIKAFFTPAAALYRARAYFISGLAIYLAAQTFAPPFDGIPAAQLAWWQLLLNKALGSLDKAGIAVLVAGLAYAVFSDVGDYLWAGRLQQEMRGGFTSLGEVLASGVRDLTYEGVLTWITTKRARANQLKTIARSALCEHYGDHMRAEGSYVDFVLQDILDKAAGAAGITRANLESHVVLRGRSGERLLEWEEEKRYEVVCPAGMGIHPLQSFTTCRATPESVDDMVQRIDLVISADLNVLFSFKDWFLGKGRPRLAAGQRIQGGADNEIIEVLFDGTWLTFNYQTSLKIEKPRTLIRVWEQSLIPETDRCYSLTMGDQPTNRLSFSMVLEGLDGWELKRPILSAVAYHGTADKFATVDQRTQRRVTANVDGWVLPGLALVVEWTPGRNPGET
jgi:hypothetical protein